MNFNKPDKLQEQVMMVLVNATKSGSKASADSSEVIIVQTCIEKYRHALHHKRKNAHKSDCHTNNNYNY